MKKNAKTPTVTCGGKEIPIVPGSVCFSESIDAVLKKEQSDWSRTVTKKILDIWNNP